MCNFFPPIYFEIQQCGDTAVFGVNVADDRIKVFPLVDRRSRSGKKYTVRFVPGNLEYGKNKFKDNKDGAISDLATGLVLQQSDSKKKYHGEILCLRFNRKIMEII